MTETTGTVTESQTAGAPGVPEGEAPEIDLETTEEGRYIPYGGGSMGWFENSGVLKCEQGNNYTFYTAMQSDRVRSKQFQRWGERFNRRGSRQRHKFMTGASIGSGRSAVRGITRDISRHGIRLQFLEEVTQQKGDKAHIQLYQSEDSDVVVFKCEAKVVWAERIGRIRPVWNLGLTIEGLSDEQVAQLGQFMRD